LLVSIDVWASLDIAIFGSCSLYPPSRFWQILLLLKAYWLFEYLQTFCNLSIVRAHTQSAILAFKSLDILKKKLSILNI